MKKAPFYLLQTLLLKVVLVTNVFAQANAGEDVKSGRISPKELSIPASPVFDLMGVTPSQVTRTSDIKDFKVDWSFKSWSLNPNLALQSQPVWELFYNRKDLHKYQKASGFMRMLASIDISAGSVLNEDKDRRIGMAAKINLFKKKDPLLERNLYEDIIQNYYATKKDLENQRKELQLKLDTTNDILQKPGIRSQLHSVDEQLLSLNAHRSDEINARAKIFVGENWNASFVDLAYGKIYTYATDSAGSLTHLRLNRNTASGIWVNAGFGIGPKILVTSLIRSSFYEEQVDFVLQNMGTGEEESTSAVAKNNLFTLGMNIRYGGPVFTFFAELIYEERGLHTPEEALKKAFKAPPGNFNIKASSVKWTAVQPYTFSFGGDWRMSRNVMLNYGMRCVFGAKGNLQTFIPVASVSCMMR